MNAKTYKKPDWKQAVALDILHWENKPIGSDRWLADGKLLDPNKQFKNENTKEWTQKLFKKLGLDEGYNIEDKQRTFEILIANLFSCYPFYPIGVSFTRNFWTKPEFKNISYHIIQQTKTLSKYDLIDMESGYNYENGDTAIRKVWPMEKLLSYTPKNNFIKYVPVHEVKLRELDSNKLKNYKPTAVSIKRKKLIKKANQVNKKANIWHPWKGEVDINLCAIFKGNFSLYGRYHTIGTRQLQGLDKEERRELMIGNEHVVELDFSAMHPHLVYAGQGIQYSGDPYLAGDLHPALRDTLKTMFMAVLNSSSKMKAAKAVNNFLFENPKERRKLDEYGFLPPSRWVKKGSNPRHHRVRHLIKEFIEPLMETVISNHKDIESHFFQGKRAGLKIMNKDSKVATKVLKHFIDKKIPCIPIHDSFIVPASYEQELKQVMMEKYMVTTGDFRCPVKRSFEPIEN